MGEERAALTRGSGPPGRRGAPRTPRGGEARRGSGAGRGDSRRSHVVESEEIVAGEGAERCHDDGDHDDDGRVTVMTLPRKRSRLRSR